MTPLLTVAICTLDRPSDLTVCLESLARQTCPADFFEVLVVDNGPHVGTKAVADSFANSGITVRYVTEERRGTTHARRRAWLEAGGDLVGYLDDDAVACPEWVDCVLTAFAESGSNIAMVGGPVEQVNGLPNPLTFPEIPGPGGLYLGDSRRSLSDQEHLWGGNFAFRRGAMVSIDAHGEQIGPAGRRPGANEDILVQRQLIRAGFDRLYEPQMRILHNSWRASADARQLDRLAFWTGVDNARMNRFVDEPTWQERAGAVRERLGRLRIQVVAAIRAKRVGDDHEAIPARRASLQSLGTIFGTLWPPRIPLKK